MELPASPRSDRGACLTRNARVGIDEVICWGSPIGSARETVATMN